MNDDPLLANETQPTKTLAEMVRADERLEKEFPRIKLPVLILHAYSAYARSCLSPTPTLLRMALQRGDVRVSTCPGRAPVDRPSCHTGSPFTSTVSIPFVCATGFSK